MFFAKLFLGASLLFCLGQAGPAIPSENEVIKGTVNHIFEAFQGNQTIPQKIAKIRINGTIEEKEQALLDLPDNVTLNQGDKILLSQVEGADTLGMGDSFENKYNFLDFARDQSIFLLVSLLLMILLIDRKNILLAGFIVANLLFLSLVIWTLPWGLTPWIYTILFILINGALSYYIYPSNRYITALGATITGTLSATIVHTIYINSLKLNEFDNIRKNFPFPLTTNQPIQNLDSLAMAILCFGLCLYSTLFFAKVSYRQNIYANFRTIALRLSMFYLFILAGFLLPTFSYFQYNNLDLFFTFNHVQFLIIFSKIIFLFWANIISILTYLIVFYIQNRAHFEKHIVLPTVQVAGNKIELDRILKTSSQASSRYASNTTKRKIKKNKKSKK